MQRNEDHGDLEDDGPGRLQRAPTAAGFRVSSFAHILKRHGLTMGCIVAVCMMIPGAWSLLVATTSGLRVQPLPYLYAVLGLLAFFSYWSTRRAYAVKAQSQWILYLLLISIAEELAFRLILPGMLSEHLSGPAAHITSNLLFAGIHYFTLRWRLVNCILAFFGGMGLSHLMADGDLAVVVLVHWLGTYLNTPWPPSE